VVTKQRAFCLHAQVYAEYHCLSIGTLTRLQPLNMFQPSQATTDPGRQHILQLDESKIKLVLVASV